MAVSRDEVLHIATLARLRLTDDEAQTYQSQLSNILNYVEKLDELDTSDVEPTTHAVDLSMQLREDEVEQRLDRDDVLGGAPDQSEGHFRVPKVVEG